ncbi:hypothetical protein F2Q70_00017394 [Brassica cretica]|uniref:Uncharacterized protein n=1 Tax=Brassica cretica TaxID=69181 RepID=A0A8S9I2Y1_BRACR|nr:hypothetical protein F2Q70_00017394 [Brassica cretica]
MSRPSLEARLLLLEFELEGSEILASSIEFGLDHRQAAFLRRYSRLELRFGRGSRSDLEPRLMDRPAYVWNGVSAEPRMTNELTVPELVFPDYLDILKTIVEPDLAWVVKNPKTNLHSHPADHPDSPVCVLLHTVVHHLVRMTMNSSRSEPVGQDLVTGDAGGSVAPNPEGVVGEDEALRAEDD